jgi:hypothetical protein
MALPSSDCLRPRQRSWSRIGALFIMAGFYFGKSSWDNIPQTLGLTVNGGVMSGMWRQGAVRVEASFTNRYENEAYYHYTCLRADIDPPLGLDGLENGAAFSRIVDEWFRTDIEARAKALGLREILIRDHVIYAEWYEYQSDAERYRAAFDLMVWAVKVVQDRRAKNPPQWELDIAAAWPSLAQGWKLALDVRRGCMEGLVGGRQTSAKVVIKKGMLMTFVHVDVPLPAGCSLSLTRQENGFLRSLFRGQDVIVGDQAFDAAFIIKGEPETFVRTALTPTARQQILGLTYAGASITLEDGKLATWTNELLTNGDRLDSLMKAAYSAAAALCPPQGPSAPQAPYR